MRVEHFDLNCLPAMFGFYRKWGFTEDTGELGFMRRDNRGTKRDTQAR